MLALALLAAAALRPELAAFERLAGHCWVGKSPDGKTDTHCFEPALGGMLLRDRHEVPGDPPYRGETIYRWNKDERRIDYTYWNSRGDEYQGRAAPSTEGVDFTFGDGAAYLIHWRWRDANAYAVSNGSGSPTIFTRAR